MQQSGPNLNAIYRLIETWSKGVLTFDETFGRLRYLMSPENFVPTSDLTPIGEVEMEYMSDQTLLAVQRIEARVAALTAHLEVPVPDEINQNVLSEAVLKLLNDGNQIGAVNLHRRRTGCDFAVAYRLCKEYQQKQRKEE
jgi:hypothetical protein